MIKLNILILMIFITSSMSFLDTVIPSSLNENTNKSSNIAQDVHLLAVMNLMQMDFQLYNDHWYKFFEIELMWISAENFCQHFSGHLVSINDAAENDFIHSLRKKNNIWIGLNKIKNPKSIYKWSDETPTSYLNWDSTQPNEPNVNCVYMAYNQDQRGTWFDYSCNQKLPQYFVCELKI